MNRSSNRQTQEKSLQTMTTVTGDRQVSINIHHTRERLIPNTLTQAKIGILNVVIPSMFKDSSVQPGNTIARPATSMDILQACVSRNKLLSNQECQKHPNCKLRAYTCKMTPCMAKQKNLALAMIPFAYKCKSNIHKQSPSFPQHLISSLAWHTNFNPITSEISTSEHPWILAQMHTSCQPVFTSWYLVIQI